jgi:hypothetical protein
MGKRLRRTDLSGKYSANIINYCVTPLIQKRFPIKILLSTGAVALVAPLTGFSRHKVHNTRALQAAQLPSQRCLHQCGEIALTLSDVKLSRGPTGRTLIDGKWQDLPDEIR